MVSFRKDDAAFDKAFRDAQKRARIMDGYHARHRDRLVELIADGADPEQERDLDLFYWCAFHVDRVISDMDVWDAWRPWGTLFSALQTYMSHTGLSGPGNIVIVWAYFLYARHLRDEVEFPAFIRETFFDWNKMPVSANLYGAVRHLVPRDQLLANQSDQRASQNDRAAIPLR